MCDDCLGRELGTLYRGIPSLVGLVILGSGWKRKSVEAGSWNLETSKACKAKRVGPRPGLGDFSKLKKPSRTVSVGLLLEEGEEDAVPLPVDGPQRVMRRPFPIWQFPHLTLTLPRPLSMAVV